MRGWRSWKRPGPRRVAGRGSKVDDPTAYHAEGVLFLASGARFAELLQLPEGTDIGKALNEAMKVIERDNPQMAGVLPKGSCGAARFSHSSASRPTSRA